MLTVITFCSALAVPNTEALASVYDTHSAVQEENTFYILNNEGVSQDLYIRCGNAIDLTFTEVHYDKEFLDIEKTKDYKSDCISLHITPKKTGKTTIHTKEFQEITTYGIEIYNQTTHLSVFASQGVIYNGDTFQIIPNIVPLNTAGIGVTKIEPEGVVKRNHNNSFTAIGSGSVTIEYKALDNSNITSAITLDVLDRAHHISFDEEEYFFRLNDEIDLMPTSYPKNTDNNYLISSSNDEVVEIVDNNPIIKGEGWTNLTYQTTDGSDLKATTSVCIMKNKPTEQQIKMRQSLFDTLGFKEQDVCQKWVRVAYENAFGVESCPAKTAKEACRMWKVGRIPENSYDLPMGCTVYSTRQEFGHVGYYDGFGYVIHQQSGRKMKTEINEFISYYGANYYGFQNGDDLTKV